MGNKYKYRLSEKADHDLVGIWNYTYENWGVYQARSYIEKINIQLNRLLVSPNKGRESKDYNCRIFPVEKHIIVYRVGDTHVEILRILHQSMDVESRIDNNS